MRKSILTVSLALNGVLFSLLFFLGLQFQEELRQRFLEWKGKAGIVIFGDSIIRKGEWGRLTGYNGIRISGFDGFTTSHLKGLLEKEVISFDPEVCFISVGINDILTGIPMERTRLNYGEMIDRLLAKEIQVVVMSTLYQENNPISRERVDSLNLFLRSFCKKRRVAFMDINAMLSGPGGLKPEYSADGTHLTGDAYRIWGEEIRNCLNILKETGADGSN